MSKKRYYRADGDESETTQEQKHFEKKSNTGHLPNGIEFMGCYFSFTNIMLISIFVLLYIKLK